MALSEYGSLEGNEEVIPLKVAANIAAWQITQESCISRQHYPVSYGDFNFRRFIEQARNALHFAHVCHDEVMVAWNPEIGGSSPASYIYATRLSAEKETAFRRAPFAIVIHPYEECMSIWTDFLGLMQCHDFGSAIFDERLNPMLKPIDEAPQKAAPAPEPVPWGIPKASIPPAIKAALKPEPVELWWQKEQREAKEAHAAVVGLRNDVRSILGM